MAKHAATTQIQGIVEALEKKRVKEERRAAKFKADLKKASENDLKKARKRAERHERRARKACIKGFREALNIPRSTSVEEVSFTMTTSWHAYAQYRVDGVLFGARVALCWADRSFGALYALATEHIGLDVNGKLVTNDRDLIAALQA